MRAVRVAVLAALALGVAGACGGKTLPLTADAGAEAGGGAGAGGSTSYDDCTTSAECLVRPASCCGACTAATRGDAIGINKDRASAWVQDKCANTPCPACYMERDPTLVAACTSQHCRVVDVLADSATACTTDTDCRIRTTSCCECGGELDRAHLVAISDEARFSSLVCEGVGACPECAPVYPKDLVARCSAQKHCEAVWLTG